MQGPSRTAATPPPPFQVGGALLTAVVIKHAGNVLKTFATVLALLMTCLLSMALFDFHPTVLFGAGIGCTALSIWMYARPDDVYVLLGGAHDGAGGGSSRRAASGRKSRRVSEEITPAAEPVGKENGIRSSAGQVLDNSGALSRA